MKRAIVVECQLEQLSQEALNWLADNVSDLAWAQSRWRIWESAASDHELTTLELFEQKMYRSKNIPWNYPIRKRSVDAVRFASKADAVYFKMRFL